MGASLVTGPTSEPVTLAEAKSHLRVESADDDATIASMIFAARDWVETETRRALQRQTWDFTYDGGWPVVGGYTEIRLPIAPVSAITSVVYIDGNGAQQTLSTDSYTTVLDTDNPRIVPAYGVTWPSVRDVPTAVTVRAVCGYGVKQSDVPESLRLAIKLLIGHWYENREAINIGNLVTQLDFTVTALVSPFRRMSVS